MNLLIVNVHSALNLGDDAIMRATLSSLRAAVPGAHIAVAANDPDSWRRYVDLKVLGSLTTWVESLRGGRFRGRLPLMPVYAIVLAVAAALYRVSGRRLEFGAAAQRELLRAYYDADLVLSCGGGNFYAHRTLSPFFVWALAAMAFPLALGKPVVMLPQSIGPIPGGVQRFLAKQVFRSVTRLFVREATSATFLARELGVERSIAVLPDLAFSLASIEGARGPRHARGERIGVTVIDYRAQVEGAFNQDEYERTMAQLLEKLANQRGASIVIFCQSYGPSADQDDRDAATRLYQQLSGRCAAVTLHEWVNDSATIMDRYAGLDLAIGTRMHTGVFALCRGVPALLIGYQPKAAGTMALLGLERYSIDIRNADAAELYALAEELLDNAAGTRQIIEERVAKLHDEVMCWTSNLEDFR